MYQFIESIKLQDGFFYRLELHQQRIDHIFATFFPRMEAINLSSVLENQTISSNGLFKTRLVFDSKINTLEIIPYKLPDINSLSLVKTSLETTFYKSADRNEINKAYSQKGNCDDVLLVKEGLITDTSYCNVAFQHGKNWITPKTPLIPGTQRKMLIDKKMIIPDDIPLSQIKNFQSICLFNAMIEFGEIILPIDKIKKA